MKKHATQWAAFLLLLGAIMMTFSGCDDTMRYRGGDHEELFSEAAASVLGIIGDESARVIVLETDSYGRTLFTYDESTGLLDKGITLSLLISQKSDEDYVYYYEDKNYLLMELAEKQEGSMETVMGKITEEELAQFKAQNDWEQELRPEEMVKTEIIWKKEQGLPNRALKKAFALLPENYNYRFSLVTPLCKDDSGKWLYSIRGAYEAWDFGDTYILIFQPDGTIDPGQGIEKLEDPLHYQEQLAGFKERNGWEK